MFLSTFMLHVFSPIVFPSDLAVHFSNKRFWLPGKLPTFSGECPAPWFWEALGFWGNIWWHRALSPPLAKTCFILKSYLASVSVFPLQALCPSLTLKNVFPAGPHCGQLTCLLWASALSRWALPWSLGKVSRLCVRICITRPPAPSVFLLYYKVWLTLITF